MVLRAEEATDDMYAALDRVVDKLLRQAERYKSRLSRGRVREADSGQVQVLYRRRRGQYGLLVPE